jgi:hypothetical protein
VVVDVVVVVGGCGAVPVEHPGVVGGGKGPRQVGGVAGGRLLDADDVAVGQLGLGEGVRALERLHHGGLDLLEQEQLLAAAAAAEGR